MAFTRRSASFGPLSEHLALVLDEAIDGFLCDQALEDEGWCAAVFPEYEKLGGDPDDHDQDLFDAAESVVLPPLLRAAVAILLSEKRAEVARVRSGLPFSEE